MKQAAAAFRVSDSDGPRTRLLLGVGPAPIPPGFPDLFITKGLAERFLDLFILKELLAEPRGESCGEVELF